jgi:hypothetical protein
VVAGTTWLSLLAILSTEIPSGRLSVLETGGFMIEVINYRAGVENAWSHTATLIPKLAPF